MENRARLRLSRQLWVYLAFLAFIWPAHADYQVDTNFCVGDISLSLPAGQTALSDSLAGSYAQIESWALVAFEGLKAQHQQLNSNDLTYVFSGAPSMQCTDMGSWPSGAPQPPYPTVFKHNCLVTQHHTIYSNWTNQIVYTGTFQGSLFCLVLPNTNTPQYTIKLSNDTSQPASGDLAEVEPGKVTTTLRATVYDSNNQPVPNVNVKLEVTVEANSGGHQHNDNRPKGLLSNGVGAGIVIEGNTGSGGMPFTFRAPTPAGDHKIKATCTGSQACTQEGPDKVWVGMKDLAPLSGVSGAYRLVGDKPAHPGNSYLSGQASQVISSISSEYQVLAQFDVPPTPVLHLNDASLERGGIFDINSTWARPHAEHCRGTVIDVRANDAPGAIPARYYAEFELIARFYNADPMWEVPPAGSVLLPPLWEQRHYHVRLLGGEGLACPW